MACRWRSSWWQLARVRGLGLEGLGTHLDDPFGSRRGQSTLAIRRCWRRSNGRSTCSTSGCASCSAGPVCSPASVGRRRKGVGLDSIDVADGLAELVDKSMLQTEETPSGRRYRMLETMRQYSADTIDPTSLGLHTRPVHPPLRGLVHRRRSGAQWPRCGRRNSAAALRVRQHPRSRTTRISSRQAPRRRKDHCGYAQLRPAGRQRRAVHLALELLERVPSDHALYGELLMSAAWGCRSRGDRQRAHELIAEFERLAGDGTIAPAPRSLPARHHVLVLPGDRAQHRTPAPR